MTKKEFIEKIKDCPDDAEVKFFDGEHCIWRTAVPFWYDGETLKNCWDDSNGFIGIE